MPLVVSGRTDPASGSASGYAAASLGAHGAADAGVHVGVLQGLTRVALPVAFLVQLGYALLGPWGFLHSQVLRMDDAYYYFKAARNFAEIGYLSFDGLHRTNGVQLLWMGILCGYSQLFGDAESFLRGVLGLSAVLSVAAGVALQRLCRRKMSQVASSVCVLLWAGFMLNLEPLLLGMEFPLQLLLLVLVLGRIWDVWDAVGDADQRVPSALGFGCLLTLVYWNRLDAAILAVGLWVGWLWLRGRQLGIQSGAFRREAFALTLMPAVFAPLYVLACQLTAGTWLPISGSVKSFYASHHLDGVGVLLWIAGYGKWFAEVLLRPPVVLMNYALSNLPGAPLHPATLAVVVMLGAAAWRFRVPLAAHRAGGTLRFLGVIALLNVIHMAVVVFRIAHFSHVTLHYYGFWLITSLLGLSLLAEVVVASARRPLQGIRLVVVALVSALLTSATALALKAGEPDHLHNRRQPIMAWMRANLPVDARIGAWNAGQLGYFSGFTLVNLDGLANDSGLLESIRSGEPVIDYLRREGIEYLIDVNGADLTFPYLAEWDRTRVFRNAIPYSQLQVVYREGPTGDVLPIEVVRVLPAEGGHGAAAGVHHGAHR